VKKYLRGPKSSKTTPGVSGIVAKQHEDVRDLPVPEVTLVS